MITDLNSYKDVKRAKEIQKGLQESLKAIQVCLDTLKHYRKFITVMESMSTLSTSQKITEIQLRKVKEFIKGNDAK